jgi:hypothetical protein
MPRPFYRSRLFWLGLPGAAALLWGGLAFPMSSTLLGWRMGDREFWIGDRSGVLVLEVREDGHRGRQGFAHEADSHDLGLASDDIRFFPPAIRRSAYSVEDFSIWSLSVSHWLVLFVYLYLWLLIRVSWWQRSPRLHYEPCFK